MKRHGHVTIMVDDDTCLRIMCGVAERCGANVTSATATRLQLLLPNPAAPDALWRRPDRHAKATAETMGLFRLVTDGKRTPSHRSGWGQAVAGWFRRSGAIGSVRTQ
jgi:hypothetical protein